MLCVPLFALPSIFGIVAVQVLASRVQEGLGLLRQGDALLEHSSFFGVAGLNTLSAVLGQSLGVGSSYMFAVSGAWSTASLFLNEYLWSEDSASVARPVHLLVYYFGQVSLMTIGREVH